MAQAKKRKKFFDVDIPLLRKTTPLFAFEEKELNGRLINFDLTRLLRGKNAIIQLKVKTEDGVLTTSPREFKILPYFLKKMVRKGTNYVEDSFSVECKDAIIRVKPFLVTRRKVSRAVRKTLRDKAKEELISYMKARTTETIFKDLLLNQLQKPLSLKLKKVYPLSLCEIRILKVEKELENKSEKEVEKSKSEEESQ